MASAKRLLCWSLLAVPLSSSLVAQASPEKSPPIVSESIDVRVVNVEAVVTDKDGRRVRGLTPADFRLLVDGREVPVEYFSEMEEGKAVEGQEKTVASPESGSGRNVLVFVDDSFSVAGHRDAVLSGIEADLKQLAPEDRMAVLAFDGRKLDVLSPWTADHAALAAALSAARQRSTGGGQRIAQNYDADVADIDFVMAAVGYSKLLLDMLADRGTVEAKSQAGYTTATLVAALEGFEAPPGRKVMFLVSAGWQIAKAPRFYGKLAMTANRLGYTLYPVDTVDQEPVPLASLEWLAGTTGGKVVKAGLSRSAFAETLDDVGSYYGLGFTPAWKGNDRGHGIQVEARRPGLTVRARQSFTDMSRQTQTALRAESLLFFQGRPEDQRLIVELGEARPAGRGQVEVPVTLGVPVASLLVSPAAKGFVAETPVSISIQDDQGGRAQLPAAHLRVKFPQKPAGQGYARFRTVLKIRKAPQHIVFTVDDAMNGTVVWGETNVAL